MSTWYSSWFSGLPTFDFSLPSAIQRRFLSFVLKKSLGHLLKPGQLDLHQIDSQIGSGVVQVRDLELDDQVQFLRLALTAHLLTVPQRRSTSFYQDYHSDFMMALYPVSLHKYLSLILSLPV